MGRVARYKKVKAFDKLGKVSTSIHTGRADAQYVWGATVDQKMKRRSLTATKLRSQKIKRHNKRGAHPSDVQEEDTNRSYFNLPPEYHKDEFDLDDLIGSVKAEKRMCMDESLKDPIVSTTSAQKLIHVAEMQELPSSQKDINPIPIIVNNVVNIGDTVIKCNIPITERDERQMVRQLNIDSRTGKSLSRAVSRENSIEGRKEGESMRAFVKRLKDEKRSILHKHMKTNAFANANPERKKRKNEFLSMKKLKKKKRKELGNDQVSDRHERIHKDYNDTLITGEKAVSRVSFLNQVEQPPVFAALPRGADKKTKLKIRPTSDDSNKGYDKSKTKEKTEAERLAMEALQEKVRAQYNSLKAKRRQERGD